MRLASVTYDGFTYCIGYFQDKFCIEKENPNGTFVRKWYKVKEDSKLTFGIRKTHIKAFNGAEGLFKHFKWCIDSDFGVHCWVVLPLESILTTVKPIY